MRSEREKPVVRTQMLVRRPVADVFAAMIDPGITSRFWFSKGSARLEAGRHVRWDWEMYGVSTEVEVKRIEQNRRILVEWDGPERPTLVEWSFEPRGEAETFVVIENWGFRGDPEAVMASAIDAAGGFAFLLAGMKAFLEHGIELDLVVDHDPASIVEAWRSRSRARSREPAGVAASP